MPIAANILLIGFMATGKTTVGRLLAQALDRRFRDSDREIEIRCGLTISEIFAYYGEGYFRFLEQAVIKDLVWERGHVIATGGGAVLSPENRRLIKAAGPVIWLSAPAEVILARTAGSHERPLLETKEAEKRVRELMSQRLSLYRSLADFEVHTAALPPEEVAAKILAWLNGTYK